MKILYLEWKSFGNEDMYEVLKKMGHQVETVPFAGAKTKEKELKSEVNRRLQKESYDLMFSFNYFSAASNVCKEFGIKYVSWVYDSPYIHVYSYTVLHDCNYIFLFDYGVYEELKSAGINTVYYLPLGVNHYRLQRLQNTSKHKAIYGSDISFVGSLYSEPKHRLYDKFAKMDPYVKGYLDGLIQAQLKVYGYNLLQDMLTEDIIAKMQEVYPTDPNAPTVLSPAAIYGDYVLARQVTTIERKEILTLLGSKTFDTKLFTYDDSVKISGVKNCGMIDYYEDMPYAFLNAKINLNITLRSIRTGIPLRAMDIMGCGGFLLTNYQEEMEQYFVLDEDFVYYTDYDDLVAKVEYYLFHEKEREEIARNGQEKIFAYHTLEQRVEQILEIVMGEKDETVTL